MAEPGKHPYAVAPLAAVLYGQSLQYLKPYIFAAYCQAK